MTYEDFIKEMEKITEVRLKGSEEEEMPSLDSFMELQILAFADAGFDRRLTIEELQSCGTLNVLYRLISDKQ